MLVNMQIRANSDPDSPAPIKARTDMIVIEKSYRSKAGGTKMTTLLSNEIQIMSDTVPFEFLGGRKCTGKQTSTKLLMPISPSRTLWSSNI